MPNNCNTASPRETAALNSSPSFNEKRIARALCDPITKKVMSDPVISTYGDTYERHNILEHLKNDSRCPKSGKPLTVSMLRPNLSVKNVIDNDPQARYFAQRNAQAHRDGLAAPKARTNVLPAPSQPPASQQRRAVPQNLPPPVPRLQAMQPAQILQPPVPEPRSPQSAAQGLPEPHRGELALPPGDSNEVATTPAAATAAPQVESNDVSIYCAQEISEAIAEIRAGGRGWKASVENKMRAVATRALSTGETDYSVLLQPLVPEGITPLKSAFAQKKDVVLGRTGAVREQAASKAHLTAVEAWGNAVLDLTTGPDGGAHCNRLSSQRAIFNTKWLCVQNSQDLTQANLPADLSLAKLLRRLHVRSGQEPMPTFEVLISYPPPRQQRQ